MSTYSSIMTGFGSYLPSRRINCADFQDRHFYAGYDDDLDAADTGKIVQKFVQITDIAERRWVTDDLVASDVAYFSAREALESSGIDGESLDYIIVAHNFGDVRADNRRTDMLPTLAARVKQKLEIENPKCIAYDLPFGCAGWLQGLIQADYYLKSGDAKRAMVIGAETLSRISDPHDRDSMLYSDGAGAAILEARNGANGSGILAHATRSDTLDHAKLIWMDGSFNPDFEDDTLFLKMNGRKVYEYAVTTVPPLVVESLEKAGVKLTDVKRVLMHQANGKMIQAILKRIFKLEGIREVPEDVMPTTVSYLGNSSVASIPTLLDLITKGEFEGQELNSGDVVVLAAVGAGMNTNSIVYRWP